LHRSREKDTARVKPHRNKKLTGDEIANVNFLYDDIVHALRIK